MDGLRFVRVLKHMVPEAGVVVASGRLNEAETAEFKRLGVAALLDKPFTQEQLLEALEKVFRE
jgi:DNA-binding NarL/FixJ family response regulator